LFQIYQLNGATNTMPSFELPNGPVLVPRFIRKADGTPDGKTRQLFTVAGRTDAGNCLLPQPDFVTAAQQGNLAYRQPLPVFGDGYIEILQNVDILNNIAANRTQKQALGIGGVANIADDGSVSRMGWKAQWRAILPAAGAEESTQMGISNEMFPTELDQTMPGCLLNPIPEDPTNYAFQVRTNTPYYFLANAERDADFIRFLAAPVPGACPGGTGSCSNGRTQFDAVGCSLCHTSTFKTPAGSIQSMGHWSINIFSDLVLHHMGSCLADGIVQGFAQGDMWRTPPLWNVGQRYFFMHDGRTMDIVQAIESHSCPANGQYPASEANAVIQNFNSLSPKNQQDLVNFLRSR
jgi:CxxC motif-containing protein (DUF1111 family)